MIRFPERMRLRLAYLEYLLWSIARTTCACAPMWKDANTLVETTQESSGQVLD